MDIIIPLITTSLYVHKNVVLRQTCTLDDPDPLLASPVSRMAVIRIANKESETEKLPNETLLTHTLIRCTSVIGQQTQKSVEVTTFC